MQVQSFFLCSINQSIHYSSAPPLRDILSFLFGVDEWLWEYDTNSLPVSYRMSPVTIAQFVPKLTWAFDFPITGIADMPVDLTQY